MVELSNYAICYEAIQRVYRNAIISKVRTDLNAAYGNSWIDEVTQTFAKEWDSILGAANQVRVTGSVGAALIDELDCLGVNHFHNLFERFFDVMFPRPPNISDDVRRAEKTAVLKFAKEVNDYRNAMSHPSTTDLHHRDARRVLDSAFRLLMKIDMGAASRVHEYDAMVQTIGSTRGPGASSPQDQTPVVAASRTRVDNTRQQAYHNFFSQLVAELRRRTPDFTGQRRVNFDNWCTFGMGRSGFALVAEFMQPQEFIVQVNISGPNRETNKLRFDLLQRNAAAFERDIGETLRWRRLDNRIMCRVQAVRSGSIDSPPETLESLREWAVQLLPRFKTVFGPSVLLLE